MAKKIKITFEVTEDLRLAVHWFNSDHDDFTQWNVPADDKEMAEWFKTYRSLLNKSPSPRDLG